MTLILKSDASQRAEGFEAVYTSSNTSTELDPDSNCRFVLCSQVCRKCVCICLDCLPAVILKNAAAVVDCVSISLLTPTFVEDLARIYTYPECSLSTFLWGKPLHCTCTPTAK